MARAQDSPADSTAADLSDMVGAARDSSATHPGPGTPPTPASAAQDSAAIAALMASLDNRPGFRWIDWLGAKDDQRPSIRGGYDSDRSRYGGSLDLDMPLSVLGGFQSRTSYHRDRFREPTLGQEKFNRTFSTDWQRAMSSWGRFSMDFNHRQSGTESEKAAPTETVDSSLNSALDGRGVLGNSGVNGKWSLQGSISDRETSSGLLAGATSTQLSKGVASGGLGRDFGVFGIGVNAGADVGAGPQTLSAAFDGSDAQEDTKTTVSDTLGLNLRWQAGAGRKFTAKFSRQALTEERLDYLKDERGVTIVDPTTRLKVVGNEREVRNVVRADLSAEDRLLRSVRYTLRYGYESKETEYALNQQNFVPEDSETLGGDLWYRYAAAGSLKVSVNFVERSDDRRLRGSSEFRGKHYTKTGSVSFTMDQRVLSTSDLRLVYAEDISRQIYEYKLDVGTQDIDVLNRRFESKLSSKPYEMLNVTALGSYRSTQNINLDANQVARNNRELETWKVTLDYRLNLTPQLSVGQGYQLSIDYTDYLFSFLEDDSQRDKFYKRTQMKSEMVLKFLGGAQFTLNHTIDRTRGGSREFVGDVESPGYSDDLTRRQDENRLYAGVQVPVWGYTFEVGTNRNVRLQRGEDEELYGELRLNLRGESRFLDEHLVLGLNVGYVWAYGPDRLYRSDRDRAHFTSASHLTWVF